jgi:hypothetical protein
MARKPGEPKRQILVRVRESSAKQLEISAGDQGYESLPSMLADQAETSIGRTFVYRIYAGDGSLLYVGMTGNVDADWSTIAR